MNIPRPNIAKTVHRARMTFFVLVAAYIVSVCALATVAGYVVAHFIIKYW